MRVLIWGGQFEQQKAAPIYYAFSRKQPQFLKTTVCKW